MMTKLSVSPGDHCNRPISVSHRHGVRHGQMPWVSGQMDKGSDGVIGNPVDMDAKIAGSIAYMGRVTQALGRELPDCVKLLGFVVADDKRGEVGILRGTGTCLPDGARPAITLVPFPYLADPEVLVMIEASGSNRGFRSGCPCLCGVFHRTRTRRHRHSDPAPIP